MSGIDYNKEFFKHLKGFLTSGYEYTKLNTIHKILQVFKDLNQEKVIASFVKATKNYGNQIRDKDATIFNTKFRILPDIYLDQIWPKLDSVQKEKMWIYLHLLFITSNKVVQANQKNTNVDANLDQNSETNSSEPTNQLKFNPYIGINSGAQNSDYDINALYSGPKVLPDSSGKTPSTGFDINSFTQGIGIDKYLGQLTDQLKNINKEDIDNALTNIKTHLGGELDEKTSGVITDMITDISNELKNKDFSSGNALQNLSGIAMSVAQRLTPKIQSSGLDKNLMEKSFMSLLNKYKPSDNATTTTDASASSSRDQNPMNMLHSLINQMSNMQSQAQSAQQTQQTQNSESVQNAQSSDGVTSEAMTTECNQILKNLGVDMDMSKMNELMQNMIPKNNK